MKKKIWIANDEDLKESDIIVGLSFGAGANGSPGESNVYLARIIKDLYYRYRRPLILQHEIVSALSILGDNIPVKAVVREHREYKNNYKEKKYLDTFEVLSQAKEVCFKNNWKTIILVAHQNHLPRSIKVAQKLEFIVNVPPIGDCPYDKKSTQKWTRGKFRNVIHEKLATIMYTREDKI